MQKMHAKRHLFVVDLKPRRTTLGALGCVLKTSQVRFIKCGSLTMGTEGIGSFESTKGLLAPKLTVGIGIGPTQ